MGHWGGGGGVIQYSNIVRNIGGKHPNTMSKIDKIPTSTSHCACLFISTMYAADQLLRENVRRTAIVGTQIVKMSL